MLNKIIPAGEAVVSKAAYSKEKSCCLIDADCTELLQFRINEEEKASRLYSDMSTWLSNTGYTNSAKYWKQESLEELNQAGWAKYYLLALCVQPEAREIPKEAGSYKSLEDIILKTYEYESETAMQCKALASCALACGDHMLYQLALKYLEHQIKSLSKICELKIKLETFGTDPIALRLFDNDILKP